MFCRNCGHEINEGAVVCLNCGHSVQGNNGTDYNNPDYKYKSKMLAGLLGLFLGGFGVHNFYIGKPGKAVAQILTSFVGIGFIWGLIDGIMILAKDEYMDGHGMPLK